MAKDTDTPSAPETVRVAVVFPHDYFDPSIRGVPVIDRAGVELHTRHLESVRAAAEAAGVTLQEV